MRRRSAVVLVVSLTIACGGATSSIPSPPTSPSPPASNQTPQITSATVSPSLGVQGLTTFAAHLDAHDPDGDPLTVTWSGPVRGIPTTVGTGTDFSFKAGDVGPPLTITVTDSKGASVKTTLAYIVADVNTSLDGYFGTRRDVLFSMRLVTNGTLVTGTITQISSGNWKPGIVDPDDPGRIDGQGRFRIRFRIDGEPNFTLDGQMVPNPDGGITGQFLSDWVGTGWVIGGRFAGQAFTFGRHNPY